MPPPRGGGAFLADNHAGLSRFDGDETAASFAGANGATATENLTPQEQLLAGTLELDPENDPVIYTTDYGLDIKWHLTGYKQDPSTLDKIPTGEKFAGYAYIEAAGVKWAIIGYSSTITNSGLSGKINLANILATYSSFSGYNSDSIWKFLQEKDDDDDAGTELYDVYKNVDSYVYNSSAVSAVYSNPSALFPNAIEIELTEDSELQADEVLCFAQSLLPNTEAAVQFHDSTNNNNYSDSNLKTYCDTWYKNNLKSSMDSYIVEKTLTTKYYASEPSKVTAKLFPLAGRDTGESYYWDTYLNSGSGGNMDVDAIWWLRSGHASSSKYAYIVYTDSRYATHTLTNSYGVRPAFVLKI